MRRAVVVAALGAGAGLLAAAPAGASPTVSLGHVASIEYVKAVSHDVIAQDGPTAECDEGDSAAGGGASVSGSSSNAWLNGTYPSQAPTGWTAEGRTTALSGRTVTAYAICGPQSVTIMQDESDISPTLDAGFGLNCDPAGSLTSGGLRGEGGNLWIAQAQPNTGVSDWAALGHNESAESVGATAYAVCSEGYSVTQRQHTENLPAGGDATATARCQSDEAVIGGGFAGAYNDDPLQQLNRAASTRPFDSKDKHKTPEDGWTVKDHNGHSSALELTAYALCAER